MGFLRDVVSSVLAAAMVSVLCYLPVSTVAADQGLQALKGLSLDDLADLPVSILSKRPERLADSAAAVYVLTAEDIRRSGYTSIPELLRLVPGLNVARADTPEWAISSRGFNGRFANKLLVMIDGRSVYTPLFSGVFWEAFDTMLEDIERIEVIRGPGASSWGANAVNGVINVITKHAADTQGALVSAYGGNQQRGLAGRMGAPVGDSGYLRLFAKSDYRSGEIKLNGERDTDTFTGDRFGLRGDWDLTPSDTLSVQGELFSADPDDPWLDGGHGLVQWDHARASGSADTLRLYYDRFVLETVSGDGSLDEDLDTVDFEYRHHLVPLGRHDVNAGLGYRWYRSGISSTGLNRADPATRQFQLFSAFVQDEIRLLDDRWFLTLGTKLEHNDFTGLEIQPSIRTRWNPKPESTLWAAVSRAVRTPSRGERDLVAGTKSAAGGPTIGGLPVFYRTTGSESFQSEELIAYELGLRWRPAPVLGLDLSLFYNDYDELRTLELSEPELELGLDPRWVLSTTPDNLLQGQTYGLELVVNWRPSDKWRLQAWYSLMQMDLEQAAASRDPDALALADQFPEQQAGLRVGFDPRHDVELDLFARFVDELPDYGVDAYTELDARAAWRLDPRLTLALIGRNLLNPSHQEYGSEILGGVANRIEREVLLRIELDF